MSARAIVVAVASALALAATTALGVWQLSRAQQKLALQAAVEQQKSAPALDLNTQIATDLVATQLHRPVLARGQWLPEHTVYLDNRVMNGRGGFYVLTPLALDNGVVILVQRGWAERDARDPTRLPPLQTPGGVVLVQGRVAAAPSRLLELGSGVAQGAAKTAIRHNLEVAAFAAETGLKLAAFTVLQTDPAAQGLLRDWPQAASAVDKHYGYAAQWFALAALIAFLYVWFQIIAPRRRSRAADAGRSHPAQG